MKLHLSSYRVPIPEALTGLLPDAEKSFNTALITNAKDNDPRGPEHITQRLAELTSFLQSIGASVEPIDLRTYHSPEQLVTDLERFDVLYAAGGNTFMLRQAMQRSGFDTVIGRLLSQGVVYAGESAGAAVAGVSLRGFEKADTPDIVEDVIWDGLGLVNAVIVPHADNTEYKDRVSGIAAVHAGSNECIILNDNQAVVVNGESMSIVTG